MTNEKLDRILCIYALDGMIKCCTINDARENEKMLLAAGWKHTATIDPKLWIEALANGGEDPSNMLDEIQFGCKA